LRRRSTLMLLAASCVTAVAARAQQSGKVYRLAWLSGTPIAQSAVWTEFVAAMGSLGWSEGKELQRREPDYEDTASGCPRSPRRQSSAGSISSSVPARHRRWPRSARRPRIPIVFYFVGDPVGAGVVATLARPGGNITGLGGLGPRSTPRCSSCSRRRRPGRSALRSCSIRRSRCMRTLPRMPNRPHARMKLALVPVELRAPQGIDGAFATIVRSKADALLILGQPFLVGQGTRVAGNGHRATVAHHGPVQGRRSRAAY